MENAVDLNLKHEAKVISFYSLCPGESVRAGSSADAGFIQRVDGTQKGSRKGQGPGSLQADAEASVPA